MSTTRRFVYRKQDDTFSEPVLLSTVSTVAAKRLVRGKGPFTIRKNHENVGPPKKRVFALASLRRNLLAGHVGDVFRVRSRDFTVRLTVREAKPAVEVLETNGNDKCDRLWTFVKDHYPKCYFLGALVCKKISGTTTWSQHAYGNAIDIGAHSMLDLVLISNHVVDAALAFDVEHVIVQNRIWTRGTGWHAYTGQYHYHVHVDFNPNQTGIPDCAK